MWCMWVFLEWNWIAMRNCTLRAINFLSVKGFWVIISWSKNFPGKHANTLWNFGGQCGARSSETRKSMKSDKTVKNALSHQNAHQHMLSTFRGQPGILGVRTVPARVVAISSQARAMGPCPAFPSLLQPFKGPGSVPCAQWASGPDQAMCKPCGGPSCPRLWPATQGSVKGQEAFSAA